MVWDVSSTYLMISRISNKCVPKEILREENNFYPYLNFEIEEYFMSLL